MLSKVAWFSLYFCLSPLFLFFFAPFLVYESSPLGLEFVDLDCLILSVMISLDTCIYLPTHLRARKG
jgi:hypothetical protein